MHCVHLGGRHLDGHNVERDALHLLHTRDHECPAPDHDERLRVQASRHDDGFVRPASDEAHATHGDANIGSRKEGRRRVRKRPGPRSHTLDHLLVLHRGLKLSACPRHVHIFFSPT